VVVVLTGFASGVLLLVTVVVTDSGGTTRISEVDLTFTGCAVQEPVIDSSWVTQAIKIAAEPALRAGVRFLNSQKRLFKLSELYYFRLQYSKAF